MSRLWTLLIALRSSLWFVPLGMVILAIALAFGLIELDSSAGWHLGGRWPRFFGGGRGGLTHASVGDRYLDDQHRRHDVLDDHGRALLGRQ